VTVSDRVSAGEADDRSGPAAAAALERIGFSVDVVVVPDGVEAVQAALRTALADDVELVVTTGGTGFGPRDLTPEATTPLLERPAPGLAEAMRAVTFGVNPHGMLSRGVAGITGATVILNLPGSVSGVEESLEAVGDALSHGIALLRSAPTEH
jgi:molybdenum cofactor biosynthesis protein B